MNIVNENLKTVKVGDTAWVFDDNYRQYDANRQIIYREHFRPVVIEAETSRSWVIHYRGRKFNINKKTGQVGDRVRFIYFSEQEIDEDCWIDDNRGKITRKVSFCKDYDTLRKIEALLAGEGE